MDANRARRLAYTQAKKVSYQPDMVHYVTFSSISFNSQDQAADQCQIACQNLMLDPQSCLGRVAVVAAIMEQHHPEYKLELGEVWDDYFKNILLSKMADSPELANDPSFMRELLMYEEPHAIVVIGGEQFEPLSLDFGEFVQHPVIQTFPLWEAVAASATVSESWMKVDPSEKLDLLCKAEGLCPGLTLVRENMTETYELQGEIARAIDCVRWALKRRPCARTLLVMHLLTGNGQSKIKLEKIYSEKVIQYIMEGR